MKSILLFCMLVMGSVQVYGQNTINQSVKIKDLMEVKKEFAQLEKTFQIQIFNGKINEANNELKNASTKYKLPVTMTFETPNYKVRVGKFRSRIEAEKALTKLRTDYPAAFVIAPY